MKRPAKSAIELYEEAIYLLRSAPDALAAYRLAYLCLLNRLQKTGLVGRCTPGKSLEGERAVVRQRLVVANHHP